MEYFNIKVKTFNDVPKTFFDDLSIIIDYHFKENNYSVFFLVIMSHGTPGKLQVFFFKKTFNTWF